MDALNRLQLHIMQDEIQERYSNFQQYIRSVFTRHQSRIGISLVEANHDAEGRVWVEVGSEGLHLRVTHLHPANPSVSDALKRKCEERREAQRHHKSSVLTGKLIYPPEDDKISISSLEDYWFNHWQGPFITADSNQNSYSLSKLRRSHRKSKRNNRCSICQKKLVRVEFEENGERQCLEREQNVLAHMPSVKLETRVLKEDVDERSDDEISKASVNEDALSRCSASDEQLTRMHRVVDNELRTSFSLFADEAVSQDMIDSPVSMDTDEKVSDPSGTPSCFPAPSSPRQSRQSRSCPCSPKLSARTYSPESISNSPKSRSFVGISKFSLSSSLMAVHRQASNSLVPEFFKSDSPGTSKHNSLRSEPRMVRHSLSDSSQTCREDCCSKPDAPDEAAESFAKACLTETQSLPQLKLSKMSLTYRGGVIISEEGEALASLEDSSEQSKAATGPRREEEEAAAADWLSPRKTLPDVVPKSEAVENFDSQEGVINLGFDGLEESSDFVDEAVDEEAERLDAAAAATASDYPLDASEMASAPLPVPRCYEGQSPTSCVNDVINNVHSNRGFLSPDEPGKFPLGEPDSWPQPPPAPTNELGEGYNTFIEKDVMQEAREMVFWWRRKSASAEEEEEFCLHETECKVKQKPLLMFLHGIGSSADVWNQQLWYFLSCGYEVVAPDLLGHGLSSAPRNKKYYSFAHMLDYISLVFDLFVPQGRKCIVVGHNYGCALAVALARGRPMSVGLVILASCGGPSPLVRHSKYENALNSTVTRILNPFISCGCLSRELLYSPRGKHYPVVCSDDSGVSSTPRYVTEYTAQGQHWPEGDLAFHRRITIPALLLYGMKDTCVSFVEMCEMEKTIPRAFLELIPGAGHELMTDCAEEVCHAMHRFIRRWKQQM